MAFIRKISISNYLIFRKEISFTLNDGVLIIGTNNAGKSAVLKAINTFFTNDFTSGHLNRTEYLAKGSNYNKTIIKIEFDLNLLTSKELSKRLKSKYGDFLEICKTFVYRPDSATTQILTYIKKDLLDLEKEPDIKKILSSVSISYIHPQHGIELLENAQEKLRTRLLARWGQHIEMTKSMTDLDAQWQGLKDKAENYLSKMLSDSLQKSWPGSEVNIELPKKIGEIIKISNINFKPKANEQAIPLVYQGTGAQMSILYNTHFILDSDRSLHKGEYHPVFLLEEPESFLHQDLIIRQIQTFMNDTWLDNIQLLITTHNPIMLAYSRIQNNRVSWILMDKGQIKKNNNIVNWSTSDINEIGHIMGDPNFEIYFYSSGIDKSIFTEDKSEIIGDVLKNAGIEITKQLQGISDVKKYLDVLCSNENFLLIPSYFIVDGDDGLKDIKNRLINEDKENEVGKRYKISNNLFVIVLSHENAMECLSDDWFKFKDEVYNAIYNKTGELNNSIPVIYSTLVTKIRQRRSKNNQEIYKEISVDYDVKHIFWKRIELKEYSMNPVKMIRLGELLDIELKRTSKTNITDTHKPEKIIKKKRGKPT